jgi:DNA invertase Pin-like site-specific DNA recombinase
VSLEAQRQAIQRYAVEQGWHLLEMLADDGVSGGKRSRLGLIADRLKATGAQRVICYGLDRFARDLAATLDTLTGYAKRGVELHIAGRGRLETKTSAGFVAIGIEAMFAEFYRKQCSEKITGALATLKAKGRQWSRVAPYGFSYQDGRAVAVEAEQATIRMMEALHANGQSLRAVSAALAAQGHVARKGGTVLRTDGQAGARSVRQPRPSSTGGCRGVGGPSHERREPGPAHPATVADHGGAA